MLLSNWDPATGLVRDKGRDAPGEFDAIQATGSLAAATAMAEQLGVVSHADAVHIVSKIADALLRDLPRFHGLWPHWVQVLPGGELEIVPNTEWSSVDTVIAAVGLLAAQNGLGLDTMGTEEMLQAIDWASLETPGGISHGYAHTGGRLSYAWDIFGGESWLVELAYAGATGRVSSLTHPSPPTANGSGFIDELAWLFVPPPSAPDVWGNDWPAYRQDAAEKQISLDPTRYPGSCLSQLGLFGLSAGEVPIPPAAPPGEIYQAFGVGGRFVGLNDGSAMLGAPVALPHYAAMIASLRPDEATAMWDWLIENGFLSPTTNVESLIFPAGSPCRADALQWNPLQGSWNLALQTLGWGRYLAEREGQIPILWQAVTANPLLRRGYRLLAPDETVLSPIPGRIEAEDYDAGGPGVSYHDTTSGNQGGQYRDDDVDVERTADVGGGYTISHIDAGEWLEYTVHVAESADYELQVRVASAAGKTVSETLSTVGPVSWTVPLTRTLHVEVDGVDVSGPMTFVATGSWWNWTSIYKRRIPLTKGRHVLRIAMDTDLMNVNWIWFRETPRETGEALIESLIAQMTVAEKIAQLHGMDWMHTVDNLRLFIPGFRMADGPHGIRGGPAIAWPVGIAMAATWDPALAERVGAAMGLEFLGQGQKQALAPCQDITRDPRNGRSAESGGEEPYLSGAIGAAVVKGLQSTRVIATSKHFAATNHQANRRNTNHWIDSRTLREFYGLPFRMAVQRGDVWSAMNAYNWVNDRPSSASRELLTRILRKEWGYPFYVVSDWGSIYTSAAEVLTAGCDLEMPHMDGRYREGLRRALESGDISMADLDRAVRRVLRTKQAAGLLGDSQPGSPDDVCSREHRALALEAAQKSIVLLKNQDDILPLDKTQPTTIALIGPSADVARLDGRGSSVVQPCYAVTPRQGILDRTRGYPVTLTYAQGCDVHSDDTSGFAAAVETARSADVVIYVGGLDDTQEGEELDRVGGSVQLPEQQQALINALAAANPNLIVVLESGGIVALEESVDNVKGLVYAFYPGLEGGGAIADVLFGDVNPGGKLPVTMPRGDGQLPDWDDLHFSGDEVDGFGYRRFDSWAGETPQYPFGHGLSYTDFTYDNLTVTVSSLGSALSVRARVNVTNTGERAGDEVVQIYLSAGFSDAAARDAIPMPVKRLGGFQRIGLEPGQTRTVSIDLGPDELAFWSVSDDSFRIQAGDYRVQMGGSSSDLPVSATFRLDTSLLYDSASGKVVPTLRPVLKNRALGRLATCSSLEGPQYTCDKAVDGQLDTRWSSQFGDPQWITVDLGSRKRISRVILHWETAYGKAYRVQVSDDAVRWRDVYRTNNGDGEVDNLALSATGRYVRIYGEQRGTGWGYSLREFEVYGRNVLYLPSVPCWFP